jgi:hypothetical protein
MGCLLTVSAKRQKRGGGGRRLILGLSRIWSGGPKDCHKKASVCKIGTDPKCNILKFLTSFIPFFFELSFSFVIPKTAPDISIKIQSYIAAICFGFTPTSGRFTQKI